MNEIGLYIHVPFCASKCPYCDFYSMRADEETKAAYVEAVKRSLRDWAEKAGPLRVTTIYFGGGTPSVLKGEQIADLLDQIRQTYSVSEDAEITVECNPSSPLETFLPIVTEAGVNRISMGMQSAVDIERRRLGRLSDSTRVEECIALCRKVGIENISLDLMQGIPEQTKESLQQSLDFCISMGVPHISSYLLKVEEQTNFWRRRDKLNLPEEETTADFYLQTAEALKNAGYEHYEISNFAKPGFQSRHNKNYWLCKEYLGIGPGAHSFLNGKRFYYERDLERFLNGTEIVPDGNGGDFEERFMLALRLSDGFSEPLPERIKEKLEQPYMAKYVKYEGKTLQLTEQGFLVSNAVIAELLMDA